MVDLLARLNTKEWEVQNSTLAKISKTPVTYEICRKYACEDISSKLTRFPKNSPFIIEIPEGTEFHFVGRVDTGISGDSPEAYYGTFERRDYISFSLINNKNVSHYKGETFFLYDILPEDIAHIFPMDSDTNMFAKEEDDLTWFPSLWLDTENLDKLTYELGVYNQITCRTKRNGKILKPFGIASFYELDTYIMKLAGIFGIKCVVIYPDNDAIDYREDVIFNESHLKYITAKMDELYGIPVQKILKFY